MYMHEKVLHLLPTLFFEKEKKIVCSCAMMVSIRPFSSLRYYSDCGKVWPLLNVLQQWPLQPL